MQPFVIVTVVFEYSYIIGDIRHQESLYLLTAGPMLPILALGFVPIMQVIGAYRTEGSFGWMLTPPLGRLAFAFGGLLVWGLVVSPGLVTGVGMGTPRLDIDLSIAWQVVPGAMLVSLIAVFVGYTAAALLKAQIIVLIGQLCIFVSTISAPVTFPVEKPSQWLQAVHQWFPFEPMAQIMRGDTVSENFLVPKCSWIVLAAWGVVGLFAITTALRYRK